MSVEARVQEFLRERGCSAALIEGGARSMLSKWEEIVAQIEAGYDAELFDLLNDLDLRQLIEDLRAAVPEAEFKTLDKLDRRFLAATTESRSLWGPVVTEEQKLDPIRHWWFYRRPKRIGAQLRQDLILDGLL